MTNEVYLDVCCFVGYKEAEAEARKEKEVDGVARLDVGGDGVDTGGQAMNMNMETPCRPPAMKRR